MHKLLISVSLPLLLCAPALADPPPPPPPPPGPVSSLRIALVVRSGGDSRTHELVISDRGCGTVKETGASYEDDIRVCSRPLPHGLLIETDWFTRTGSSEYRTRSEAVMSPRGGTSEIGRAGGIRLGLKLS